MKVKHYIVIVSSAASDGETQSGYNRLMTEEEVKAFKSSMTSIHRRFVPFKGRYYNRGREDKQIVPMAGPVPETHINLNLVTDYTIEEVEIEVKDE